MNIPRSARAQMAEATVTIINSGQYSAPNKRMRLILLPALHRIKAHWRGMKHITSNVFPAP